jgi:hypothetical protein
MGLVQAAIELLYGDTIDAKHQVDTPIKVQFNPTEYTLQKSAQIAEIAIPGLDSPILQFIRGQNERLTLDLFFDTTKDGMGENATDVTTLTNAIYQLVKIQSDTHAPPRIRFVWGKLSFKAIVESVQQKFTLFNPNGIPLRATLSVTFREYKTLEDQLTDLNLKSSDHTKQRVVKKGETLHSIAGEEYDDPSQWVLIAQANEKVVTNPRRLVPGVVLRIPPLDTFNLKTVK